MPKISKKTAAQHDRKPKKPAATKQVSLPGYVRFSKDVLSVLAEHRAVFLRLILLAWAASLLLTGLSHYVYYDGLTQSTEEVAGQLSAGVYRTFVEVGALTASIISGATGGSLTETQNVFVGLLYLLLWLTTVWLLRHLLSGNTVGMRDGLYGAAAPLVSTCLIAFASIIQLLPLALMVSLVATVASTGTLNGIIWVLLGIVLITLFAAVALYWLSATAFAAVIVTLPGTYPWVALRSAREVISGYRVRVILRLLWLSFSVLFTMVAAISLVVLLDALTGYNISMLVILISQLASIMAFTYGSAYIYLLYRGVIDERG
jgi:hypothetical protein